jgi:5-methylthioribose kinase
MEALRPHIILRKGLVAGTRYPRMAEHMGTFLARTLFLTSDLALTTQAKKALMARFAGNAELCATTEEVVFAGPYWEAPLNRWTRPQLDGIAAEFRADADLKLAAAEMRLRFRTATEALIHGDLHTGSIMATPEDTRVIDPEWAFHGPMGFDVGALIGNLLLAYCSQPGHATPADPRQEHAAWILRTVGEIWDRFAAEFLALWREQGGDLLPREVFPTADAAQGLRERRIAAIFRDTLGFGAAKMIRRILGISHVEDFEAIADPDRRAACEAHALRLGARAAGEQGAVPAHQRGHGAGPRHGGRSQGVRKRFRHRVRCLHPRPALSHNAGEWGPTRRTATLPRAPSPVSTGEGWGEGRGPSRSPLAPRVNDAEPARGVGREPRRDRG